MTPPSSKRRPRPLDIAALERLALRYVERYATTRARLRSYLVRKVRERGWQAEDEPPVDELVGRLADLGYVDDASYAAARGAALQRRGFGERRVTQALAAAGIEAEQSETVREQLRPGALAAALRFAERRRFGPFAAAKPDREHREKAFAAMVRAGHPIELVRRVLASSPGEVPDEDLW